MGWRILLLTLSYLLGSIPSGYLVVKRRHGADIRRTGSGGTGATNVLRRAGVVAAALTFLLDLVKGAAAVWLMWRGAGGDWGWAAAAAVAAIVGHNYPVWLGFRGGKGVAPGAGAFLMLSPLSALSALLLFILVVYAKRYVSLGSIVAAASLPLWVWLYEGVLGERPRGVVFALETAALVGGALLVISHRQNISRLLGGTESKLGSVSYEP